MAVETQLEFQITGMHVPDTFVLVSGNSEELEVLSTVNLGVAYKEGDSLPIIEDTGENVVTYLYSFDSWAQGGPSGKATDPLEFYEKFSPPWLPIATAKDGSPADNHAGSLPPTGCREGAQEEEGKSSTFDAAKALRGA